MNTAKIEALKAVLDQATEAYNRKRDELVAAGLKSKDRYEALKDLKAAQDAANSEYVKYTKGQINRELTKIIVANKNATPEQQAKNWATSAARAQLA